MRHVGRDSRATDERSWTTPRRGRPGARPWREPLPAYPLLVRRGRAAPVNRGTRRGIRRNRYNFRPRGVRRCNFRLRNIPRDAPLWQPPRRTPPDAPAWREPLPACRSPDHRGPAGPVVRDSIQHVPDKARTPAVPASTAKGTIRRSERSEWTRDLIGS